MPRHRDDDQHDRLRQTIKEAARRQMAEYGTAGITVRGIAREMDLSAPALYRYFPSLDALITDLILDGFNALADALEQARDALAGASLYAQMEAVMLAYRAWALDHPVDFQLIYGNPIPGYAAPGEITVPAAQRTLVVIVGLMAAALAQGELIPDPGYEVVPPEIEAHLQHLVERDGYDVPVLALYLSIVGWPVIHGLIMLELFDHLPPVVGNPDAFYRVQIRDLFRKLGLKP
jgi:AcrR family transcriptional regulator